MVSIQISHKFASIESAQRIVKSLIEYIRYTCKQRKYFCQGIIAISNVKSSSVERVVTDNTKQRGRPKLFQIPSASEIKRNVMHGEIYKVRPQEIEYNQVHLHMLIFACPSHMLAELIRKYLYKVLNDVDVNDDLTEIKLGYQKEIRGKIYPSSIGYIDYIMKQSLITRFLDYRYCDDMNDFPQDMTFKNYYNALRRYKSLEEHYDPQQPQRKPIIEAQKEYQRIYQYYMAYSQPIDVNEYKYRKKNKKQL